ncbi:exopolysaccharide transport family protein [Roseibium aestuarii]|uniref:Succinoglycan transporter n=1 Tax=Roseibium aestuarii TaxID=2600299 RepID=A0ABW4JS69_9HYPH|nr:exopolysaccharide transport family protein [Roseibium aestuarii]
MPGYREATPHADMALDLKGLLGAIGRSLRWLLPLVLIVAATVFVLLTLSPKKYLGSARVLIESTSYGLPGGGRGAEEERALLDEQGVASQVQLLMSADLARRVVTRLDLGSLAEFEAEGDKGLADRLLSLAGLGQGSDGAAAPADELVLRAYFKRINVYRLEGSRVIAVEFTSQDPQLAARVANTIVDEYLALQAGAKRETTEVATLSLQPQIVALRDEVQAARKAVAEFRSSADLLLGSGNQTLLQQQLVELGTSYNNALASRDEAQAKASQVRGLISSGGALETASDVLNSQLIQRLRERQAELQANVSELSITLLPNHPQLKALQSQLNDYDRLIRREAEKVLAGLESDARVAQQQAEALGARLEDLKQQVTRSNADQVRLDELEREAAAKERQLDILVASYREADTRLKSQVLPADARIISRAIVPIEPYAPKIIPSTILAAVATFVFGCALVVGWAFLTGAALYPVTYGAARDPRDDRAKDETIAHEKNEDEKSEPETIVDEPATAPEVMSAGRRGSVLAQVQSFEPLPARQGDEEPVVENEAAQAEAVDDVPAPAIVAPRKRSWLAEVSAGPSGEADSVVEEADFEQPVTASPQGQYAFSPAMARHLATMSRTVRTESDSEAETNAEAPLEAAHQEQHASEEPVAAVPQADPAEDAEADELRLSTLDAGADDDDAADATEIAASEIETEADDAPVEDTHAPELFQQLDGMIVVLTVDNPDLSHKCAFHLARAAADRGYTALLMEAFPELEAPQSARGFSDLVSGEATFAKVIYGDAGSSAHLIEAGTRAIPDEVARQPRFAQTLEVISSMYETVVIDLGAIDGSLASVQILRKAERVLLMAEDAGLGIELEEAARLLRKNSRAQVEVFTEGDLPSALTRGAGHAA